MRIQKNKFKIAVVMSLIVFILGSSLVFAEGETKISNHWAKKDIEEFKEKGYINKEANFRPDSKITRAEFITILNKILGLSEKTVLSFSDVKKNAWYYEQVAIAYKSGYINGYSDNTFRANSPITRAEACVILVRANKLATDQNMVSKLNQLVPDWAKNSVELLYNAKIISGYSDGSLGLENNISRAEAVVLLSRMEKTKDSLPKVSDISGNNSNETKKEKINEEKTENSKKPKEKKQEQNTQSTKEQTPMPTDNGNNSLGNVNSENSGQNSAPSTPSTPAPILPKHPIDIEKKPDTESQEESDGLNKNIEKAPNDPSTDSENNPPKNSDPSKDINQPPAENEQPPTTDTQNSEQSDSDMESIEAKANKLKNSLSKNENPVTQFKMDGDENDIRTVLWTNGMTPPEWNEFTADRSTNDYLVYTLPYTENKGWYDTNKSSKDADSIIDRNLCFAAVSSNMLHWWMNQNKDDIASFIEIQEREGKINKKTPLVDYTRYVDSFKSQEKSEIFEMFKVHFGRRETGYEPNILIELYINGYRLRPGGGYYEEFHYEDMVKDSRGGFFKDVFKGKRTAQMMSAGNFETFSRDIKNIIYNGGVAAISHSVNRNDATHVITVWGLEFDVNGKIVAIYISDSDDYGRVNVGMQRYELRNVNNNPVIGTQISNKKSGSIVYNIYSLSSGKTYWKNYMQNLKNAD